MTAWTRAHKCPLSVEFPRQDYWGGLPYPTLADLPDPGIEPISPVSLVLVGRFFTTAALGKHCKHPESGKVKVLVIQSCPTLCNPVDCSPPGSSVHGILQARILEWVAISFSRQSSRPRDQTQVSCTAGRFFTI